MAHPAPVYLDCNATAPVRPEVRDAVTEALATVGNPSSVHAAGRAARRLLEQARRAVATLVGAPPERIVFTSGGTEANNLALSMADGPGLVSAVEHPSVLEAAPAAERLPVDTCGRLDLGALEAALARRRAALVAVMLANNETGVVQPVREAATLCRAYGARLHCDAVQGPGKLPIDMAELGCDSLALSAHKLGGPQGAGALVLAEDVEPRPLIRGGGQERHHRAGTENLPGIVGFGVAAELALADRDASARLRSLRDRLEAGLRAIAPEALVIGQDAPRLPNTTCVLTPGIEAETQVMALDLDGIAVSSGSACSSGKVAASHVLRAMGLPEGDARSAIRVSLGWANDEADIDRFLEVFERLLRRLRPGALRCSA